ncbi:MAG: sulfurtransferase TusA family protein [bacterium]
MSTTVDARGLSCPQPVLLALDQMKQQSSGEIVVLLDSETSRENVSRAATGQGWSVKKTKEQDEEIQLTLEKD